MNRFLTLVLLLAFGSLFAQSEHPFLIVKASDYEKWIEKADQSPWKDVKERAMDDFNTFEYDPNLNDIRDQAIMLRDILSSGTLTYILDPTNREAHKDKLLNALAQLDNLYDSRDNPPNNWDSNVPVGCAVFNAILTLDILYNNITEAERTAIEADIEKLVNENRGWYLSEYAVKGTWALYKNDRENIDRYKDLYQQRLNSLLTEDGIFTGGPGYSLSRFVKDEREQKYMFMDVLEFTGEAEFYNNPKLKKLYEWIFSQSLSAHGSIYIFGDSKLSTSSREKIYESASPARVHKFSKKAAAWAAWHQDTISEGRLLVYLGMDTIIAPERPDYAQIYKDGGAFFIQNPSPDNQMSGILWNPKSESGHSHKETNAIALAAYGEDLMLNSGYSNWGNGSLGFSWNYIHNTAVASNTALIDGQDHRSKSGGGLEEGFMTAKLSYARGLSGDALRGGTHIRNFLFVPGQAENSGYWLTLDEFEADNANTQVNTAFHPYAETYETIENEKEYQWTIQHWTENPVHLSIFLATPPDDLEVKDGLIADKENSIVGKYLYSTYNTNPQGKANVATLFFPHNAQHAKPEVEQLAAENYAGAIVSQNEIEDVVLAAKGGTAVQYDDLILDGQSAVLRYVEDSLAFFFAVKSSYFKNCGAQAVGFESERPVSLFLEKNNGKLLVAESTELSIFYPGITGISLNGEAVLPTAAEANQLTFNVEAGTYDLEIEYDEVTVPVETESCVGEYYFRNLAPHPRLMLTDEVVENLNNWRQTDTLLQDLLEVVEWYADSALRAPLISYEFDAPGNPRLKYQRRHAMFRIFNCGLMYRLTGDTTYAARIRDELLSAANFPDWGPSHFLNIGEISTLMAIGYDWTYDFLTPEERAIIREGMVEHGLKEGRKAYNGNHQNGWWINAGNNWNQVCNGGLSMAALALADEVPELSAFILQETAKSIPNALRAYLPDGAWHEGPTYWAYGTTYNGMLFSSLETALGDLQGMEGVDGYESLGESGAFHIHTVGPTGYYFNYADSKDNLYFSPVLFWLSQHFDQPGYAWFERLLCRKDLPRMRRAELMNDDTLDRFFALLVVWYSQAGQAITYDDLPLDKYFRGETAAVGAMHSDWSEEAIYLGFKGGKPRANHAHMDIGSFVLDAEGERWAMDLGGDNKDLPGYSDYNGGRWQYFRLNNLSHNTLSFSSLFQNKDASVPISQFYSFPDYAYAEVDMSDAYMLNDKTVRSFTMPDRNRVIIQDRIEGGVPSVVVRWAMVTDAEIELNRSEAFLRKNGKVMKVRINRPEDVEFTILSMDPQDPNQRSNEGTQMLAFFHPITNPNLEMLEVEFLPNDSTRTIFTNIEKTLADNIKLITYPNPFSETVQIDLQLPESERVTISVHDMTGKQVQQLFSGNWQNGTGYLSWDGKANAGQPLSSGVYFLKVQGEQFVTTRKLILQRAK